MSTYIDADAFVRWEKGEFDLLAWIEERPEELLAFPATVWQQLSFGVFGWQPDRAAKRARFLRLISAVPVIPFMRAHALRAAPIRSGIEEQSYRLC